uniref:Uncharacterized protein n=1 Tax=Arundo donax TaxID=35708 RepID=A0A0A9BXZ6_ARUDO
MVCLGEGEGLWVLIIFDTHVKLFRLKLYISFLKVSEDFNPIYWGRRVSKEC